MVRALVSGLTLLFVTALAAGAAERQIDFERDVAPVLTQQCVDCHGPGLQMADLRLDQRRYVLGDEANPELVKVGKSAESLLIQRLVDAKLGIVMPPSFPFFPGEKTGLVEAQIATLKAWIDQGAKWPENVKLVGESSAGQGGRSAAALFMAIRAGDQNAVARLLEDHSLLAARTTYGETALIYAAAYADADLLKMLIERGADVNEATPEGATALIRAAGDLEKTKLLLDRGAKVEVRTAMGRTPLLVAATYPGNLETVRLLVSRGANIADQDSFGETCMTSAAKRGDAAMVTYLLEVGANPVAGGRPPLVWAAEEGNVATMEALLKHGGQPPPVISGALSSAAARGPDEAVRLLLDHGADANAPSPIAAYTPLMWAAYSENCSAAAVEMLLKKGADAKAKGADGLTASLLARRHGETPIAALLPSENQDRSLPTTGSGGAGEVKAIVEQSLTLLQQCGPQFFNKTGCLACHQQTVTSLALAAARERGIPVDEGTARDQKLLAGVVGKSYRERFLQRVDHPAGSAPSTGYLLLGMHADGYEPDEVTDAMIFELLGRQHLDGSWTAFGHRPPLEYSRIGATALALRAMQLYGPPGLKKNVERRLAKASDYLVKAQPANNVERAFRLFGLAWAGNQESLARAEAKELLAAQRDDGGWAQAAELPSDAYATGFVLYALDTAGTANPADSAFQRGLEYLLKTRRNDGSWHVRTRSFPFQPYFESGFPHGHDQWISAAATGFATVALIRSLPQVEGAKSTGGGAP